MTPETPVTPPTVPTPPVVTPPTVGHMCLPYANGTKRVWVDGQGCQAKRTHKAAKPKPKPDRPKRHVRRQHVCMPLADGTKRIWYPGGSLGTRGCKIVKTTAESLTG